MHLRKKLKVTLILLLICLVVLFSASYAWVVLSLAPEVTSIETNVGANGSLEIALLSDTTYVDPISIRTGIGDSAVAQDVPVSNRHWGNVIDLTHASYGLEHISLLPARLNAYGRGDGTFTVSTNPLKVADFGIDGRISILNADTVSAVYGESDFTYFTAGQNYGVRAIGTISNLTSQQIALSGARIMVKSHTAAAARSVKSVWKENGPDITTLLCSRYFFNQYSFTGEEFAVIRGTAVSMRQALLYMESVLRQGAVGLAASQIANESAFRNCYDRLIDTSVPLSQTVAAGEVSLPEGYSGWISQLEDMKASVEAVIDGCDALPARCTWDDLEPLMDVLLDANKAFLGESRLSTKDAYSDLTEDNLLTLSPYSGMLAKAAEFSGNYSVYCSWNNNISIEARTQDPDNDPCLVQVIGLLEDCRAAAGGWTRSNLDMVYGYAIDMAFRCNVESDLLLQTTPVLRVQETAETPVTQGGGSYMRFTSEEMDTDGLLTLMDTIRVAFLDDRNTIIAVAKLNVSNYEEREDGVFAPLYLYDFTVAEDGKLVMGQRREENSPILALNQNTPVVLSAVVWLDGDSVNNSMVATSGEQSMSGILNLQFSSSADLNPLDLTMKNKK